MVHRFDIFLILRRCSIENETIIIQWKCPLFPDFHLSLINFMTVLFRFICINLCFIIHFAVSHNNRFRFRSICLMISRLQFFISYICFIYYKIIHWRICIVIIAFNVLLATEAHIFLCKLWIHFLCVRVQTAERQRSCWVYFFTSELHVVMTLFPSPVTDQQKVASIQSFSSKIGIKRPLIASPTIPRLDENVRIKK